MNSILGCNLHGCRGTQVVLIFHILSGGIRERVSYLLNDAVYLRIFIYNGTKMKLGSLCKADRAQSNGPTLGSLANFNIELEHFCCSLTARRR